MVLDRADKEFRVTQLVEAVGGLFGRQPPSFEQRLIDQFLDGDQKQFMFCVPKRATLREPPCAQTTRMPFAPDCLAPEHTMRELVQ